MKKGAIVVAVIILGIAGISAAGSKNKTPTAIQGDYINQGSPSTSQPASQPSQESTTTPTPTITPNPAPDTSQTQTSDPSCDPNYTGCVPNVYPADVDCAGGSGNGPYYAQGPVQVIGTDRYGLDRDGDGTACE